MWYSPASLASLPTAVQDLKAYIHIFIRLKYPSFQQLVTFFFFSHKRARGVFVWYHTGICATEYNTAVVCVVFLFSSLIVFLTGFLYNVICTTSMDPLVVSPT